MRKIAGYFSAFNVYTNYVSHPCPNIHVGNICVLYFIYAFKVDLLYCFKILLWHIGFNIFAMVRNFKDVDILDTRTTQMFGQIIVAQSRAHMQ